MVNAKIATAAEQPINTHGALAGAKCEQADPVGIDPATGKMVKADADSGTAIPALGVAMAPISDLADYASAESAVRLAVEANHALVDRDRLSAVTHGIVVENGDGDWGFTPGDRIYLAAGGGYTATAPATSGDVVQVLGTAIDDGEAIALNVMPTYEIVA